MTMGPLCSNPFCTTLAIMLGTGSVTLSRAEDAGGVITVTWQHEEKARTGRGASVAEAISNCCTKWLDERRDGDSE